LRNRIVAYIFATIWFRYKKNMEVRRDVFQAIADPTRRAIIVLLAAQALTPNALAEYFATTRQAVSKHLKILAECDLVKSKQEGREIFYELEVSKMKEIDKWLDQFRKIWEGRYQELDKVLLKLQNRKK
jgi:DNA-binding transcriptional ArsR family regulator